LSELPDPSSSNPYAAPSAEPPGRDASNKDYRVNMINRRSTAVVLELAVWYGTIGPVLHALLTKVLPAGLAGYAAIGLYYALRDFIPVAASARQLVGLRLASSDGGALTGRQRLLRNVILVVPAVSVVEYLVAYYGGGLQMRRLGDRLADTYIHDADPSRATRGSHTLQLVGALVLMCIASMAIAPVTLRLVLAAIS
jgi:hypothetical protein